MGVESYSFNKVRFAAKPKALPTEYPTDKKDLHWYISFYCSEYSKSPVHGKAGVYLTNDLNRLFVLTCQYPG